MPTATTKRKTNPSSLNDREPKTVKDLSIEPTVPELEYVDLPEPVPVIWRNTNNKQTEGQAISLNSKGMVRVNHGDRQSDTPIARLVQWGEVKVGASARIESPSNRFNGQICRVETFHLKGHGEHKGQVAVFVGIKGGTFSYFPHELKLESASGSESSAIEKSDNSSVNQPNIATEVEAINSELNETEATFVNAGRATLSLYKLLGEKLAVARQDPEIGGYGKWGNWLKARGIEESRAKRAIRIGDPANWSKLEAIAQSQSVSVTDFTLTDALNALAEKRLPPPEEPTLDRNQVAELFEPWGEFKANSGSNAKFYPFVLERPSGAKCFRSLNQAIDWHSEHCNDDNRLDAPKRESIGISGAVPFAPNPERVAQLNQQLAEKVEITPTEMAAKAMPDLSSATIVITSQEEIQEETEISIILPRVENDFYPTAQALTEQLLEVVDIEGQVLEPCAGDGAIADLFTGFIANEPFPHASFQPCYSLDATERSTWEQFEADGGFDWAVTNPPFNLASKILPLSFEYARTGVAFLLRLSYLEPCDDRADWLKENADHLRHVIPVSPRPRFRSDSNGSDSVTTAWFVWRKDFSWEKLGIPCPFTFVRGWR